MYGFIEVSFLLFSSLKIVLQSGSFLIYSYVDQISVSHHDRDC